MTERIPDIDSASEPSPGWGHLLCALVGLALLIPFYRVLLSADLGPLHRDFGTIFLSKMQQQVDALRAGKLLFWDPILYSGTAFWPLPNTAPAYPPLLLAFLARGSALGGLNLAILLHIFWGGVGTYVLVHSLTRRRFAALAAGLLFIFARYTHHLAFILPLDLMALAWMPWTLHFLLKAQSGPRWLAGALTAAICYSAVAWCGGYNIFLYGLILLGTILAARACRKPLGKNLARASLVIAVFFGVFLLLSAGRLIPTALWLPMTSRAEALPFNFATRGMFSLEEIGQWLSQEGWIPLALLVAGFIVAIRGRLKDFLPLALALTLIAVLSSGVFFPFLHEYVPGFSRMREPRRVVIMTPAVLPIAVGLVLAWLQAKWRSPNKLLGLTAGVLFLGALAYDVVGRSDFVRPEMHSLSARLAANKMHLDLVERARTGPRFRVHDFDQTRINLKRTADLIRSSLRIESLEAVLGNISVNDYDRDYFGASAYNPARLWGLMNCRYVSSGEVLDVDGLELVKRFPDDPKELKEHSDGPYLYRNERALPRAFLAGHVVLAFDTPEHAYKSWRFLVYTPTWNPFTTTLILGKPEQLYRQGDDFFDQFEMGFTLSEEGKDATPPDRAIAAGLTCFDFDDAVQKKEVTRETIQRFLALQTPLRPLPDPERGWNETTLDLPDDAGGQWLILAETYAIYPGWTARVDGLEVPLWVANGAATAILLPADARRVTLNYHPPGLTPGLIISMVTLAAALVFIRRRR